MECMCGNVIRGKFDPSLPFFTEQGSFWTNSTSKLLASTTEKERQGKTRNYCNYVGYESVALIPIKDRGERIGLVQLNDIRIGMFDEKLIKYLEMIAEHTGLAVSHSILTTKSQERSEKITNMCANCKKIRDDKGNWHQVDSYFRDHWGAQFSHCLCPECMKKLYPGFKME